MSAITPENTVRSAATVIIAQDIDGTIQILLLHKNPSLKVFGDHWVFPGGAVDPGDQSESVAECLQQAAVRETLEETAVELNKNDLIPISRWLAPEVSKKRFDTRFFLTVKNDPHVVVDNEEIIDYQWITPWDAITQHEAGKLAMMPPTLVSLKNLLAYDKTHTLIQAFRVKPYREFLPKACIEGNTIIMLYQDDVGYEKNDPQVTGKRHRCFWSENHWVYINDF